MRRKSGFTLIEILVVIAIMGILITIGAYGWSQSLSRNRDNVRKGDLRRLQLVLQQYYLDSREYPDFDATAVNKNPLVYSAVWQLSSAPACTHGDIGAKRLAPTYISAIPEDPQSSNNWLTMNCSGFVPPQQQHYYYISGPSTSSGPAKTGTSFGLLAHLEHPNSTDLLSDSDNPLKSSTLKFGAYYNRADNYAVDGQRLDANYLVTGTSGH